MEKKNLLPAALILALLASTIGGVGFVNLASANGIPMPPLSQIYIKSDGSVEPSTAPIQREGNTYTVVGGLLNSSIEVQRDNIIIDGSGFTLQAPSASSGIGMVGRSNVTVKNFIIKGAAYGINLTSSSNNIISQNTISSSSCGVYLTQSCNNMIFKNDVKGNGNGIRLTARSIGNTLIENNVISNIAHGLILEISSYNNTLRKNRLENNGYNFYTTMNFALEEWLNDIDTSNVIGPSGNTMYYWINRHDEVVPQNAGYVALIECTNITVEGQVFASVGSGVLLVHTSNSFILDNKMTFCNLGVYLWHSSNNVINGNEFHSNMNDLFLSNSENNIISENSFNNELGIYEQSNIYISSSSGNKIYRNNFYVPYYNVTPAPLQILTYDSVNTWDDGYPSGGNYWSDSLSIDEKSGPNQDPPGSDGIGDTPYVIDADNQDRYPLMNPVGSPQPPIALFTYSPEHPVKNQIVPFNASASYDRDGSITSYKWDFGDGNITTTTDPIITHVYTETGAYTVNFTITDNNGLTHSTTQSITVSTPPPSDPPTNDTTPPAQEEPAPTETPEEPTEEPTPSEEPATNVQEPTPSPEPQPEPEPFPTTMVIAPIASVAVIGIGLLYFKKRNR